MATVTKDFRVKAGLVVEGSTATVNSHDILTEALVDAKGDLLVASAADAVTRLAVGTDNYVLTADSNATNGVAWKAPAAVGVFESSISFEGTTADSFETTLSITDPTADRTITFPDATGTVALTSDLPSTAGMVTETGTQTLTNKTLTTPKINENVDLTATSTELNILDGATLSVTELNVLDGITASTTELNYVDGVTSAIQTQLNAKAASSDLTTHTGASSGVHGITGAVVGTTDTQTLTNKTFSDSVTLGGTGDFTFTATNDIVFTPGASKLVKWGADTLQVRVADVSDTEIGYLNGVTSAIQTQLDAKFATANASTTNISEGTNLYFTDERAQDAIGNNVGNGLDYDDSSGAISVDPSEFALSAVGAPTGDVAMATYKITGLGTPTNSTDAATKAYVDSAAQGIDWKASVRAATTANITLASDLENGDTLDGVTLATGDRVLVKNQSTGSENGIYVVAASGAPTRSTDCDTAAELTSNFAVFVEEGTTNADQGYVLTNDGAITVGTTALAFTQFTGLGQIIAGTGLDKTGNTLDIDSTVTTNDGTQTLTNKSISGSANTLTNIPNNALSNSAITINGTSVSLGGTRTLGSDDISEGSTNKYFTDERAQDAVGNAVGTGLAYNDSTGAISNAGVTELTGTSDQVTVSASTGSVTLSLPQSIATTSSVTFSGVTAGSVTLADALVGTALATASTSATTIDTWSATTYSSAKYLVQMKKGSDIEVIELLVTVDGNNNVYLTEYADVISNTELGTTNAVYSGGNVLLQVTGASADTSVKVHKVYIEA